MATITFLQAVDKMLYIFKFLVQSNRVHWAMVAMLSIFFPFCVEANPVFFWQDVTKFASSHVLFLGNIDDGTIKRGYIKSFKTINIDSIPEFFFSFNDFISLGTFDSKSVVISVADESGNNPDKSQNNGNDNHNIVNNKFNHKDLLMYFPVLLVWVLVFIGMYFNIIETTKEKSNKDEPNAPVQPPAQDEPER